MPNLDLYYRSINKIPLLSKEEEIAIAKKATEGNKEALNKLITANLRFVLSVAHKYKWCGVPLEDLVQEGNIGLITAANKFDPSFGVKFCTYAVWWIRAKITIYIMKNIFLTNRITTQTERSNFFKNITKLMAEKEISLNNPISTGNHELMDFIPDNSLSPEETLLKKEVINFIQCSLIRNVRNHKEWFVLINQMLSSDHTLQECGNEMNLSRERIRQIKQALLNRSANELEMVA